MVSNSTQEIINYSMDLQLDLNMKILFICMFIVYALVMFYLDKKVLDKTRPSFFLMSMGFKLFYIPILIYAPTFVVQLARDQDVGFLLTIQTYIYSIGAVFGILILSLYLLERLFKDFLGWEISMDGFKIKTTQILEGTENGKK